MIRPNLRAFGVLLPIQGLGNCQSQYCRRGQTVQFHQQGYKSGHIVSYNYPFLLQSWKYYLHSNKSRYHPSKYVDGQYSEVLFLQGHDPKRSRPTAPTCGFGISDSKRQKDLPKGGPY